MAAAIPKMMRSLVAPRYCSPAEYKVIDRPVPTIQQPNEILIKIHSCSLMSSDAMMAKGMFRAMISIPCVFPL